MITVILLACVTLSLANQTQISPELRKKQIELLKFQMDMIKEVELKSYRDLKAKHPNNSELEEAHRFNVDLLSEIENARLKGRRTASDIDLRIEHAKKKLSSLIDMLATKGKKKKKKDKDKSDTSMNVEQIVMKERIEDFLKEKKKKRNKEKEIRPGKEKCPRFGLGKKEIKIKGESRKRKPKYPCCRKCCKKSYMGCL